MARADPGAGERFDLDRFVAAQEQGGTYDRAWSELRAGRKVSHWMWFVFPQLAGLGQSAMSRTYGIASLAEARAYLDHAVLGARIVECARLLGTHTGLGAHAIFGATDAIKLRSSMTLFAHAAGGDANVFRQVLHDYFDGAADAATEARLADMPAAGGAA